MRLWLLKAGQCRAACAEWEGCKQADTEGACLVIRERILPGKDVFCDFILAEHSHWFCSRSHRVGSTPLVPCKHCLLCNGSAGTGIEMFSFSPWIPDSCSLLKGHVKVRAVLWSWSWECCREGRDVAFIWWRCQVLLLFIYYFSFLCRCLFPSAKIGITGKSVLVLELPRVLWIHRFWINDFLSLLLGVCSWVRVVLKKTASLPVNPHSLKGSLTHGLNTCCWERI